MKVGALLIIALLFADCSHQPVNNKANDRQDLFATLPLLRHSGIYR